MILIFPRRRILAIKAILAQNHENDRDYIHCFLLFVCTLLGCRVESCGAVSFDDIEGGRRNYTF